MPQPNYNFIPLTELLNSLENPQDLIRMLESIEASYLEVQNNIPADMPALTSSLSLLGKLIDVLHETLNKPTSHE